MQSQVFVACMASIFTCMPGIPVSLFSLWFCLDSQDAMNRSGPGFFYKILTLYWCFLNRMVCSLFDSAAMYFLQIGSSGL